MLSARGLLKRYPGVTALDDVDFEVKSGEVVALIGENGAGKSTLIKIFAGLVQPDAGQVFVTGKETRIAGAQEATQLGIGVIHQELCNLGNLSIAGNVFLGREPRKMGIFLNRKELQRRTLIHLETLGLKLHPATLLSGLSIAQQQMVEIAKALSLDAKVLIMDEPTSSLTAGETDQLLRVVRDLRSQGVAIVYVSHRLDEVKAIGDRVVALRDGKNAGALSREQINAENMVRLMVGRDIEPQPARPKPIGRAKLQVRELRTTRYPGAILNFEIGEGEILGLAGLVGAGRTEVAQAIFGITPPLSGEVMVDGACVAGGSPKQAILNGLLLVPEDRRIEGLITEMNVRENVTLPSLRSYASGGIVSRARETAVADKMRERLHIKTPSVETAVKNLSGGNQQKVVLAKWLSLKPKCLIFDEPTRGIDVGARWEIYGLMRNLADEGVAILMISSDMEEILAMSDRVMVMHEGEIAGFLEGSKASEESVMNLAVGHG